MPIQNKLLLPASLPYLVVAFFFTICFQVDCLLLAQAAKQAETQEKEKEQEPASLKIVIAEEPKTIDPTTTVYEPLAKKVTIEFDETSIREVVKWMREQAGLTVLIDEADLADENILLSEPVSDRLQNEPLYLLLDRLQSIQLGWYVEEDILHITTKSMAIEHLSTVPHNIGSFLDQKFKSEDLKQTIINGTQPDRWEELGGNGTLVLLGDVMFIRQSDDIHRKVAGLLKALSKHGRRTFVDDPVEHESLRKKLTEKVSVEFSDTPLSEAIQSLAKQTGADIRIDTASFRRSRIREREPVSLKLNQQKLSSVLQALVASLRLTWTLQNGAILITTEQTASSLLKAAVFDVRDLSRDSDEAYSLAEAIMMQTSGQWEQDGGNGSIDFAKPGVMVVRNTEESLEDVLRLLNTYREALKISKVRKRDDVDPNEVITRYYKMPTVIANDLEKLISILVAPETWKTPAQPKGIGTVTKVASTPVLISNNNSVVQQSVKGQVKAEGILMEHSVLIVRQTRGTHDEIQKLIFKIENGNLPQGAGGGLGGGGLGGGGGSFGGGFFSMPDSRILNPSKSDAKK